MRADSLSAHLAFLFTTLATAGLAACADSGVPVSPGDAPDAPSLSATLVAHIDGHDYFATQDSGFTVGSVTINKGGITLYARVTNAASALDAPLTDADFEFRVMGSRDGAPLPSAVEFTRYDAFSGSLYWVAPGQQVPLYLGLYHKSKGHFDLGPFEMSVYRLPNEQ